MTIKELIKKLKQYDSNKEVMLFDGEWSKDFPLQGIREHKDYISLRDFDFT